ncbi:MAG: transposase family protein [Cyclobacteriaceae bacterium]|nr:transposase family protein [Cyclobacteriaceae bacterium]
MGKYEKWASYEGRFLAMTGLSKADFDRLLPFFECAHDEYLSRFEMSGRRKKGARRFVIYKNSPLPDHAERLSFILYYLKQNPIQEAMADTFDMEQAQCNEYIHGLSRILAMALQKANAMPAVTNEAFVALANRLENKELIHDATEREVPRPQDADRQKDLYSGKKKRHTVKNAVIATMMGLVLYVSPNYAGRVHDKRIADTYTIPGEFVLWQDTGYQGYAPADVVVIQPTRKPKGKTLSEEEGRRNHSICSTRVRIEHFIGSIKRYRIVKDECRTYKDNFREAIFATCTGLHNFRVLKNPPKYADNQ